MKCQRCNNEVQAGAFNCQVCGTPQAQGQQQTYQQMPQQPQMQQAYQQPQYQQTYQQMPPQQPYQQVVYHQQVVTHYMPKSRVTYVILALFLGGLGVHNFYANRTGCAVAQLLITLLSFGFAGFISGIWALIEAIAVTVDGKGIPFK